MTHRREVDHDDGGSTIPLILGLFLLATLMVAGSIVLGEAFLQQRDLQDLCDGAAAAAAASSADLDRGGTAIDADSLRFADVQSAIDDYLARDPDRQDVHAHATLSPDREQITVACSQRTTLTFGQFFDRASVLHTATSTARSAVTG